jgi:hypothetical protein
MNDDATDGKKPNNNTHYILESLRILSHGSSGRTIHSDVVQKVNAHVEVKDCRDANGTEEANKRCLVKVLNLWDVFMHSQNHRNAAEEKNEGSKKNEPIDGNHIVDTK